MSTVSNSGEPRWHLDDDSCCVLQKDNRTVATTMGCDAEPREANARLIAAAPDEHEALCGLVGVLDTMNRDFRPEDIWELLDAWAAKGRAAIAKAEGRA